MSGEHIPGERTHVTKAAKVRSLEKAGASATPTASTRSPRVHGSCTIHPTILPRYVHSVGCTRSRWRRSSIIVVGRSIVCNHRFLHWRHPFYAWSRSRHGWPPGEALPGVSRPRQVPGESATTVILLNAQLRLIELRAGHRRPPPLTPFIRELPPRHTQLLDNCWTMFGKC